MAFAMVWSVAQARLPVHRLPDVGERDREPWRLDLEMHALPRGFDLDSQDLSRKAGGAATTRRSRAHQSLSAASTSLRLMPGPATTRLWSGSTSM
jgi:hypothetical protein